LNRGEASLHSLSAFAVSSTLSAENAADLCNAMHRLLSNNLLKYVVILGIQKRHMANLRHLPHAPIKEAIIDCRVKAPDGFKPLEFRSLKDEIGSDYPRIDEQFGFEGQLRVEKGQLSQSARQTGLMGVIFRSTSGENVAQFRIDGFTFSRLKPYTSWESIFPEAFRLWKLYANKMVPEFITRIAVRYINELRIPIQFGDFSEYLSSPPIVPPDLPRQIAGFLTRIVIPASEFGAEATITQAMVGPADPDFVNIILDIDVHRSRQYEIADERIGSEFEELRQLKNRIFFSSITEKTARLFE
jgi:uncharacterized protein (TIGR04255 family)